MNGNNLNPLPIDQTEEVKCEKCGNNTFIQVFYIRKIPKLLARVNNEGLFTLAWSCSKCGHINAEFQPKTPESKEGVKPE